MVPPKPQKNDKRIPDNREKKRVSKNRSLFLSSSLSVDAYVNVTVNPYFRVSNEILRCFSKESYGVRSTNDLL